jgi:hypothetical protein
MKYYEVRVIIPASVEKTIYIDDATSKTDAIKKAKAWGKDEYDAYDYSGDENEEQYYSKLKVVKVVEGK